MWFNAWKTTIKSKKYFTTFVSKLRKAKLMTGFRELNKYQSSLNKIKKAFNRYLFKFDI